MNSKKFLAFTMAAAMTLSLAACGGNGGSASSAGGSSASASAGDTTGTASGNFVKEVVDPTGAAFKIGATGPLTGAASIYGLAAYRGCPDRAVNEINSEGGDIQFELNYQDDQNVPETAVNAFNNLKDWGMQISLGSVTTQPGIATSQYNFEDRIFALTPLRLLPRRHQRQGQRIPDVLLRPQPGPGLRPVYL